jgi:hypothetical protein
MSKLSKCQEVILFDTQNIFGNENNLDFIQKISKFINQVFPNIEELNRNSPKEFDEIERIIYTIILTYDIKEHTFYIKNQDFKGLNNYRDSYLSILRIKVISLENSKNLRLKKFILGYGYLIDDWLNGENGSRAILKEVKKNDDYCYIATMVYGDYNHPNVIHLRNYRDDILKNYELGRIFIKYYYKYSPVFIKKIKNNILINNLLKILIDFIVFIIKK